MASIVTKAVGKSVDCGELSFLYFISQAFGWYWYKSVASQVSYEKKKLLISNKILSLYNKDDYVS